MSSGECPQIASARSSEKELSPWSLSLKDALRPALALGSFLLRTIKIIVFTFKGQLSGKL